MRIHFLHEPTPEMRELMLKELPSEIGITFGDEPELASDFELLVGGVPRHEHITASPQLRCLVIPYAGLPGATRELMKEHRSVAVHNLHHNAVATAETAMALFLAAFKSVVPVDRSLRAHDWTPRYEGTGSRMISGRRALILGYGAIGRAIARACLGFGMQVTGVRRHVPKDSAAVGGVDIGEVPDSVGSGSLLPWLEGVAVHPIEDLHVLLPEADALFLSVPLTPETEGLIGERELALLPDQATIVNVARGLVLDERALYDGLKAGRIRAGLDVWYRYPRGDSPITATAPSDLPFHELDNVVMSPHRAGHADLIEEERAAALVTTLLAAYRKDPIPNPVDLDLGY